MATALQNYNPRVTMTKWGALGLVLFLLSFFFMISMRSHPDLVFAGIGFVMFEAGSVMALSAGGIRLNKFWVAGLILYYPSFILTRLGMFDRVQSHSGFWEIIVGLAVSLLACGLAWKGQVLHENQSAEIKEDP